jgi:hypothetical protein
MALYISLATISIWRGFFISGRKHLDPPRKCGIEFLFHACYMPLPPYQSRVHNFNNIWRKNIYHYYSYYKIISNFLLLPPLHKPKFHAQQPVLRHSQVIQTFIFFFATLFQDKLRCLFTANSAK